ncbi:hypothetical protein AAG570_013598 [Ranatra chinensis]|uniref:Uncharacterized protein n=1 Tax=Ranatra chinensis TaxID=642074 RepID=A0ABD0YCX6_9HEMI
MFVVRVTEAKFYWLENRDLVAKELSEMIELLEQWLKDEGAIRTAQQCLQEQHSQMAILKEAEAQPQHSLFTLGQRYSKYMSVSAAQQATINALKNRIKESELHLTQYQTAVISLRGPEVAQWINEVSSRPKQDVCLVFDLIKEFLQNAGQNQMVQQCVESEREMGDLCCQQTLHTSALLEMLIQYGKISRHYPSSYILTHRASLYQKWATLLLNDMTPERCEEVMGEMKKELTASDETLRHASLYYAGLQRLLGEAKVAAARAADRARTGTTLQLPEQLDLTHLDHSALQAVILIALCNLNKKFLMMESAATSAGDRLLDLTSRDGDWFLEDMCLISGTVLKLVHQLPSLNKENIDAMIQTSLKCLRHTHDQYKALQEMHVNFSNIILGEAMQALQFEEFSVLAMINKLEQVIMFAGCSLQDLLGQLQLHLRFTIMGMESPHEGCKETVNALRVGFSALVNPVSDQLTQGEMLLMGFNGLFTNLTIGAESLVTSLASLQCPSAWKNVDQIREARSFAVSNQYDFGIIANNV